MTFRKNFKREKTLLRHWMKGDTVREAAEDSGIPEGTISHYYARFNRNKKKYQREYDGEYQEPPKADPIFVASIMRSWANVHKTVIRLTGSGEYSKARDYLQMLHLFIDLETKYRSKSGFDRKIFNEMLESIILLDETMKR